MAASVKPVRKEIEDAIIKKRQQQDPGAHDFAWHWEKVRWELLEFDIQPIDPTVSDPYAFADTTWDNCTTEVQQQVWREEKKTTDTFTISFTEGIELGAEVEVGVDIPCVGKGNIRLSTKLSFSSTQTTTVTQEQTHHIDLTYNVPKCTKLIAEALIYMGEFESDFTASVKGTGHFTYEWTTGGGARASPGIPQDGPWPEFWTLEGQLQWLGWENRFDANGSLGGAVGIQTNIETDGVKPDCRPESACYKANISHSQPWVANISQVPDLPTFLLTEKG
jgi:hypothetical protein